MTAPIADRMQATIPRARVTEIAGAYHHLVLDAPAAFAQALEEPLRRHAGAGRSPIHHHHQPQEGIG